MKFSQGLKALFLNDEPVSAHVMQMVFPEACMLVTRAVSDLHPAVNEVKIRDGGLRPQ